MKCEILHLSRGGLSVHMFTLNMSLHDADVLEYYLRSVNGVESLAYIYIGKGIKALLGGNLSNYTSALSEADAGIAINTGAAIAKEIADITVSSEDFFSLLS